MGKKNWNLKEVSNLHKVTQFVSGEAGPQSPGPRASKSQSYKSADFILALKSPLSLP